LGYNKIRYDTENKIMRPTNLKPTMSPGRRLSWMVALAFTLLVVGTAQLSLGQTSQSETFSSPGEASTALFQAVQNEDEHALEAILGAGNEVTSSSDEVEDKLEREQFSQKYQEMHRLVRESDGSTVLYVGAENWPFPIPLVSNNGAWYFDSKSGMEEIKFRRVGENEVTAVLVCNAFPMANRQGATRATGDDDSIGQYAQGLVSAGATNADGNRSSPFHGYYFRVVTGNSADGTNKNYVSGGRNRGVSLVAYPADYRSSGIRTFIVTPDGVVYEKDLGPNTTSVAPTMSARSSGWHSAE
jgi:hypothetical protein